MTFLKFRWLGPPEIESDGRPLLLEMRKSLALLAYLSLSPQYSTRETLATLFWPEYDQQHSMASLRRSLSSLKGSLPPGILNIGRESVGIRKLDCLKIDVDEFITLTNVVIKHNHPAPIERQDCLVSLEKAINLYRGNFLEGFSLKDCPEFDEWQYFQRESLLAKYALAVDWLIGFYASSGLWDQALSLTRSWVTLDRLSEPARRKLVFLLYQSGQQLAARRQAEELLEILSNELDQKPEGETVELLEKINIGWQDTKKITSVPEVIKAAQRPGLEPLLKTKLYIPFSRGKKVIRRQVLSKLNRIADTAITLISAPAGYGKTTALSEWLKLSSWPVGWLSLDSADNNPFRILTYLISASQEIQAGIGEDTLWLVQSSQTLDTQEVVTSLLHDYEMVSNPFVIVLDDYQVIQERRVHELLANLFNHLPNQAHLVISTRVDPPLNLARLRVQGKLLEIRSQDLRFTTAEAQIFFNEIMNMGLSSKDTALLNERTEGWAVGIQMAALSLQKSPDKSKAIQSFSGSNRYILDYLLEEVIGNQPEYVQDFMMRTSILAQMNDPLCDAVTGISEWKIITEQAIPGVKFPLTSQQLLEYLERSNLFIQPLDDERCWYRYHHLFAELLQARLSYLQPDLLESAHLNASRWYETNGFIPAAVRHALLSKDFNSTAAIIERAVETNTVWRSGDLAQLLHWIEVLPNEVLFRHPMLRLYLSSAFYVTGDFKRATEILDELKKSLPKILQTISDPIRVEQVYLSFRVLFEATYGNIANALSSFSKLQTLESDDGFIKFFGQNYLLLAYLVAGDVDDALQVAPTSYESFISHGFALQALSNAQNLADIYILQGKLTDAIDLCKQAIERCNVDGMSNPVAGIVGLSIGTVLLEQNDLVSAEQKVHESLDLLAKGPLRFDFGQGYALFAMIKQAQGDRKRSTECIERALKSAEFAGIPRIVYLIQACQARIWLAQGEIELASNWAQVYQQLGFTEYPREFEDLTLARVLIQQKRTTEASGLLIRLLEVACAAGRHGRALEALIILALVNYIENRVTDATRLLRESLQAALKEGYIRSYLDEGKPMRDLLLFYRSILTDESMKTFPGDNQISDYVDQLLTEFERE